MVGAALLDPAVIGEDFESFLHCDCCDHFDVVSRKEGMRKASSRSN